MTRYSIYFKTPGKPVTEYAGSVLAVSLKDAEELAPTSMGLGSGALRTGESFVARPFNGKEN